MAIDWLFELSGEHPQLARLELEKCLTIIDPAFQWIEPRKRAGNDQLYPRMLIVRSGCDLAILARRLALTRSISRFCAYHEPEGLEFSSLDLQVPEGSVAVEVRRHEGQHHEFKTMTIKRELGAVMGTHHRIELKNPDHRVTVFLSNGCYIGIMAAEIDRKGFEGRRAQYRPYFSPISLHPKLARCLVNLAGISPGQRLLDPFCGTGGILIEAGLVGAVSCGSDIDDGMIEGCRQNLDHFGIGNYILRSGDISTITEVFEGINAIVTDPPYGRATSTAGEPREELYERAAGTLARMLAEGGCDGPVVIALPTRPAVEQWKEHLELECSVPVYVHRSLTRYFTVFSNR